MLLLVVPIAKENKTTVRFLCCVCCLICDGSSSETSHHEHSRNEGRTQDRVGLGLLQYFFRAGIAHAGLRNGKMKPLKKFLQRNTCALARNERTTLILSTLLYIFLFKQAVDISRVCIYWLVDDRLKYIECGFVFTVGWFEQQTPKIQNLPSQTL